VGLVRIGKLCVLGVVGTFALLTMFGGCSSGGSGGGTGGGGGSQPTPDFTVAIAPGSLTVTPGSSQTATVTVTALNGFAQAVQFSTTNVPTGVTVSPSTFSVAPGAQQVLTVAASNTASAVTATLSLTGTAAALSHSGSLALSVPAVVTSFQAPSRMQYVRTNGADVAQIYDAGLRRFFSANSGLGLLEAFDAVTEKEVGSVSIPQPNSIDISPLDGTLYVVSLFGDVWQIDPTTLQIKKHYASASIGPNGYAPTAASVLADGRLALRAPSNSKFVGADGYGSPVVWDPVSNTIDAGPGGRICPAIMNFGAFAVSGDRTRILVSSIDTDGTLCSYDPVADLATTENSTAAGGISGGSIIPTPDGKYFFENVPATGTSGNSLGGMGKFDAKTLQLVGLIQQPAYAANQPSLPLSVGGVISADGKTLWLTDLAYGVFEGWDTTSLQSIGYANGFRVNEGYAIGVSARAIDETGLIFGYSGSHGVGFVDVSKPQSGLPGVPDGYYGNATPFGPISGGTSLSFSYFGQPSNPSLQLSSFYVGNTPASQTSMSTYSAANGFVVSGSTPAAATGGAADAQIRFSDGSTAYFPEIFSYGPTILALAPNAATPEGGQTAALFGYGLGSTTSDVTITVGGLAAKVLSLNTSIYKNGYPVPLEYATFQLPAGIPSAAADLTVSNASGSTTEHGAFFFTAQTQSFPSSDKLEQGLYDAKRDLYYFTGKSSIEVLSGSGGGWQSAISLPGTTAGGQLTGIAESPDGTKLAVGDLTGAAVYVLNPDSPTSVLRFALPATLSGYTVTGSGPGGLAISNAGVVYFADIEAGDNAEEAFITLDTTTGTFAIPNKSFNELNSSAYYTRVLITPDSKSVLSTQNGYPFVLDATSGNVSLSYQTNGVTGDVPDLAISQDGSTAMANFYFTNGLFQAENYPNYIDWELMLPTTVYGQKLRPDGGILYLPLADGIDLVARNSGRLLYRVQLANPPANVYDPIFVAKGSNAVGVITPSGVTLVDLSSLPIGSSSTAPF
jgi:hypothetical protein